MIIGGYKVLRVLGQGGFGAVYLVEKDGQKYALKKLTNYGHIDRFLKEAYKTQEIRERYNLEYIIKIYDLLLSEQAYVMEYLPQDAMEYYQSTKDDEFLVKLIRGVAELHKVGVAHRDLKPENIRVRGTDPVILDFGIASWWDSQSELNFAGTEFYIAPEYLAYKYPTPLVQKALAQLEQIPASNGREKVKNAKKLQDVYGLAMTVGVILTGSLPYRSHRDLIKLTQEGSEVLQPWIESMPEKFRGFIREATAFFPLERPFLHQLIAKYFPSAPASFTMLPAEAEKISEEIPYICLNCGNTTEPPAKFCNYCGAKLRYLALHISPSQPIETEGLPPSVRFIPFSNAHHNFSHQTLLIDLEGGDFQISLGRTQGHVKFPEDSWMSRSHGRIYKKGKEVYYLEGDGTKMPTNPSKYNNIPVGSSPMPLDAGGYLIVGSTLLSIEKYFGEI